MKLYKKWTQMTQGLNQTQAASFWQEYFETEKEIYDYLLNKKEPRVSARLDLLAKELGVGDVVLAGFLDGINESIEPSLELDELESSTQLDFTIDYEKLYFNMMEAKADWLYNLEVWQEILHDDKRKSIRKDYLALHTRSVEKVGRNQPCPCGSGKKYKFCCMNKE